MRKTEVDAISKAVAQELKAERNLCQKEEEGCPIGLTEEHVQTLDDFTQVWKQSKKTAARTFIKIIFWGIIGGFIFLFGEKAKDIVNAIIN